MTIPELNIDLDLPPADRWRELAGHRPAALELIEQYVRDLGGLDQFGDLLISYSDSFVPEEYRQEIGGIAELLDVPLPQVLLSNLYYDALKAVLGCTGFAIDSPSGPIHARNLDWGTENAALSRHTMVVNYQRKGTTCYSVVGWPGYVGCMSGIAPRRFAVTLNAVLSEDPLELAPPVSLLLRQALESAAGFEEAVDLLSSSPVSSDCLLLVSGKKPGEMAVIERSPNRSGLREPTDGFVVVTNDYRALDGRKNGVGGSELADTSCTRFDRTCELLTSTPPTDPRGCFQVLLDDRVRMSITVQTMVFCAASGTTEVRLPDGAAS